MPWSARSIVTAAPTRCQDATARRSLPHGMVGAALFDVGFRFAGKCSSNESAYMSPGLHRSETSIECVCVRWECTEFANLPLLSVFYKYPLLLVNLNNTSNEILSINLAGNKPKFEILIIIKV